MEGIILWDWFIRGLLKRITAVSSGMRRNIRFLLSYNLLKSIYDDKYVFLQYKTSSLLAKQYYRGDFNRMDVIVRYMFIESYLKGVKEGIHLYRKMQKRRGGTTNTESDFIKLIENMGRNGFDPLYPIPVNQHFQLLDGSHRLACALFYGIEYVPITIIPTIRSNPVRYGIDWFLENGFTRVELNRILEVKGELFRRYGLFFVAVLWPPVERYFDEILAYLRRNYNVVNWSDYEFENDYEFAAVVEGIYASDDIEKWKIEKKIKAMKNYEKRIRVILFEIPEPKFRVKMKSGKLISMRVEEIKRVIREKYRQKIKDYYYDIIIHIGDNYEHSRHILQVLRKDIQISKFLSEINMLEYALIKTKTPYMVKDFPKNYPLSKDLDIITGTEDYESVIQKAIEFAQAYKDRYDVIILNKSDRVKIRFMLKGFLCYQLDISCGVEGLKPEFIERALRRRVFKRGYYTLRNDDEILIRALEYVKDKSKTHHFIYLRNHKDKVPVIIKRNISFVDGKYRSAMLALVDDLG